MTLSRRGVVLTAAGAGIAVPLLAACGAGDVDTAADSVTSPTPTPTASSTATGTGAPGTPGTRPAVPPLAATSDIKVGGGKIFGTENVVVTQPTAGEFKAFDATCTHQGCPVSKIVDQEIVCTCHFSKYSIADGSVESGPAPAPLSPLPITVTDGEIYLS